MEKNNQMHKCSLCQVFFDESFKAKQHMEDKHHGSVISGSSISTASRRISKRKAASYNGTIVGVSFLPLIVSLKRLSSEEIDNLRKDLKIKKKKHFSPCSLASRKTSASKQNASKKDRDTVKENADEVEIRLDTLKASEIERLMNDMFKASTSTSAESTEEFPCKKARRSGRKVKETYKRVIGELNSDDEEIVRTGTWNGSSKKKKETDYSYNPHQGGRKRSNNNKVKVRPDEEKKDVQTSIKEEVEKDETITAYIYNTQWKCRICKIDFSFTGDHSEHMKTMHQKKDGSYDCPICKKSYPGTNAFNRHMQRHERKRKSHPKSPKLRTATKSDSTPDKQPFQCKDCGKIFKYPCILAQHKQAHENGTVRLKKSTNNPHECPICQNRYATQSGLKRHFFTHLENNPFKCKDCNKTFGDLDRHTRHILDCHSNPGSQKCHICPKTFRSMRYLVKHMKFKHIGESIPSQPSKESVNDDKQLPLISLRNQALLEDPVVLKLQKENPEGAKMIAKILNAAQHSAKNCIKCSLCSWSTTLAHFYERHMKTRHNLNPDQISLPNPIQIPLKKDLDEDESSISVMCGSCGYKSKSSEDLKKHISTVHIGNRKYKCLQCGKSFIKKFQKDAHDRRIHSGRKKIKCSKCNDEFSTRETYRTHWMNKHESKGENFPCPTCNKELKTLNGFKLHLKQHTDVLEKSICQLCGQGCAGIHSLRRHIQYVHMKVTNPYNERNKLKKLQANGVIRVEGTIKDNPVSDDSSSQTIANSEEVTESGQALEIMGL